MLHRPKHSHYNYKSKIKNNNMLFGLSFFSKCIEFYEFLVCLGAVLSSLF